MTPGRDYGHAIRVGFDGSPSWPAIDTGRRWNGWIVPIVTAEVRDAIATWLDGQDESADTAAEVRACEPYPDSDRVTLDLGLTFSEAAHAPHGLLPIGARYVAYPCQGCGVPVAACSPLCGTCGPRYDAASDSADFD